jgi:hypothetical protein
MPQADPIGASPIAKTPLVKELHILWTPDGMSCDGDTISITAATPAEHRGCADGGDPRPAEGAPA